MFRTTALENLSKHFAGRAAEPCLIRQDGTQLSYGDVWERAGRMARRLHELGGRGGTRVLVRLDNSENVLLLYLACAIGGVAACPVDPGLPKPQVNAMIAALRPALVIDDATAASVMEAPSAGAVDHGTGADDEDFLLIFSSGSTGDPKGIVHSLRSMTDSARSFAGLSGMNADSVVYHHFPMFYMAGIFNLFFCPIMAGARVVIGPRFSRLEMLRFWQLPTKHGVNCLTLTPTMALSLCQLYRRDERVLEHLARSQSIVATGSALYPSIAERFLSTFRVPLRTCYGVTEVGGTVTFQSWEDAVAFESMGGWAENTQIRAGTESEPAEIRVKTPFMAKGYLVKGEIVRPYDAEGYFRTGDQGYVKDGRLFFTGREHDLVKKGGEFVSMQLVENLALQNPHVQDVAAVGVPDDFWGARVVLFYVPNKDVTESDVLPEFERLFSEGLRELERPDKIIPVPWMPKSSIGKILKRELVAKYSLSPPPRG